MGKYSYKGLSDKEVEASREKYGPNGLPPPEVETFWEKLFENFQDPLIKILMVALVITIVLAVTGYADWLEGVGIAAAVFLATFVSTYSEHKNETSFQKLQEEASQVKNNVFRNGKVTSILVGEVVKGDYVLLQAGDKVPADGHLVEGNIHCAQAALTGEPYPVVKHANPTYTPPSEINFSDKFVAFRESVVVDGEAVLIVDSVGTETQYGKISAELGQKEARPSPLQFKLERLADNISTVGYIGAIFIALSFLFKQFVMDQNYDWAKIVAYVSNWQLALKDGVTALILGIIIIVVAVPEGLPMMIAIVLSLNMSKLLASNVLVRKLLGIETAGSLNILFSDKTGTLTKGKLETHLLITGDKKAFSSASSVPSQLQKLVTFSVLNSTSALINSDGEIVGGNASDRAFVAWVPKDAELNSNATKREREVLFTSEIKFSASQLLVPSSLVKSAIPTATFAKHGSDARITIVKGAPEKVIPNCTHFYNSDGTISTLKNSVELEETISNLSYKGMRVVALALTSEELTDKRPAVLPHKLTLVGVLALKDEIRPESLKALKLAKQASIQVVMITGDRVETAVAIAKEIQLLPSESNANELVKSPNFAKNAVITSSDLQSMSDDRLAAILPNLRVVARALPTDKSRLVRVAQGLNLVVGMTGDGVNDAAALKKADVGFAMGSGTEVAKEASDLVILDDNFYSIALSVLYGRTIFRSIRKFIVFQSTINVASTLIVFLGPFMGFDFPLTLIQLLWVNLVMDTLAALAFGGEPALPRYMNDKPISRTEAIISPDMWSSILSGGIYTALASAFFLTYDPIVAFFTRGGVANDAVFLTAFFCFFIFTTTVNAFNVRTPKINLLENISGNFGFIFVIAFIWLVQIGFSYFGGSVLRTVPLLMDEWKWIMLASLAILPFDMLRKLIVLPFLPKSLEDPLAEEDLKHVHEEAEEEDAAEAAAIAAAAEEAAEEVSTSGKKDKKKSKDKKSEPAESADGLKKRNKGKDREDESGSRDSTPNKKAGKDKKKNK